MADGGYATWGTCTIEECSATRSIFQYRPSLAANSLFIALYGVSMLIHAYQGLVRWRQWTFGALMVMGCICEMIGYGGRLLMWKNPWDFNGFIIQIVCITIAPVFFTAAIYVQLYKSVLKLSPQSALFKPALYYQIWIPLDIIALVLQAVGGAMSAENQTNKKLQTGVDVGLAGLSFQVVCLFAFIVLALSYGWRYRKDVKAGRALTENLDGRFKFFLACLTLATTTIFIRCAYRIYELNDGYGGPAIHNQVEFMILESAMVTIAVFALNIGHPGLVFAKSKARPGSSSSSDSEGKEVRASVSGV